MRQPSLKVNLSTKDTERSSTIIVPAICGKKQNHEFDHYDNKKYLSISSNLEAMELSIQNEEATLSSIVTNCSVGWFDVCRRKGKKEKGSP